MLITAAKNCSVMTKLKATPQMALFSSPNNSYCLNDGHQLLLLDFS